MDHNLPHGSWREFNVATCEVRQTVCMLAAGRLVQMSRSKDLEVTWGNVEVALTAPSMNRMNPQLSTSVVIAGAGPVGLALACELGLRGIECMLVEKRDGAVVVPKQSMVSSRNMEFCRRWGVAEAVRNAVWPESHPRDFVYLDN